MLVGKSCCSLTFHPFNFMPCYIKTNLATSLISNPPPNFQSTLTRNLSGHFGSFLSTDPLHLGQIESLQAYQYELARRLGLGKDKDKGTYGHEILGRMHS